MTSRSAAVRKAWLTRKANMSPSERKTLSLQVKSARRQVPVAVFGAGARAVRGRAKALKAALNTAIARGTLRPPTRYSLPQRRLSMPSSADRSWFLRKTGRAWGKHG